MPPLHRRIVAGAGTAVVPAPVDGDGVVVDALATSGAGAAVVTPARQSLLGTTLAPARRSALLSWARAGDRVVVEDDYDGELRYDRQPIGAVQGLDPERVVPGDAQQEPGAGPAAGMGRRPGRAVAGGGRRARPHSPVSSLDQLAVAGLLRSQSFDRHLRRRRATYRRRRDEFVDRLASTAPRVRVEGVAAGLRAGPLARGGRHGGRGADRGRGAGHRGHGARSVLARHARFGGLVVGYGRPPAHDARRRYEAFAGLMADLTGNAG